MRFLYFIFSWCCTVKVSKPILSGHSKLDETMVLKTNGSLMKVESIAECSLGAFCNTFDLHLAIIRLENHFLVFLSGCLRQVLLYVPVRLCIVTVYLCTCYVILFLDNKLIIMRKLKDADQVYTYLMKLKFNKCVGPYSNCRQLYYTKKILSLCL